MANKLRKVLIYSHSTEDTTGIDDEMYSYLKNQGVPEVTLVQFPFTYSKNGSIRICSLSNGMERRRESTIKFYKPEPISLVKDILYGVWYGFKFGWKADFLFASNNLLAVVGIFLRSIGVVKRVGYNIIDYTPVRYGNPLLNSVYTWVDRFAAYHADHVFPLNKEMIMGRVDSGLFDITKVSWSPMPFGNNSNLYSADDYSHGDAKKLVFFGGLIKSKGVELLVPIMQELKKLGRSDLSLVCIGGGEVDWLKSEVKKAGLEKVFDIRGRIQDHHEVEKILLSCGVALAPYNPHDENSFSRFADVGKVKVYLGCALPVVITDVPPVAKVLSSEGAGLISEYDAKDIAAKIMKITEKESTYKAYRQQAMKLGADFAWPNIFKRAISILTHE